MFCCWEGRGRDVDDENLIIINLTLLSNPSLTKQKLTLNWQGKKKQTENAEFWWECAQLNNYFWEWKVIFFYQKCFFFIALSLFSLWYLSKNNIITLSLLPFTYDSCSSRNSASSREIPQTRAQSAWRPRTRCATSWLAQATLMPRLSPSGKIRSTSPGPTFWNSLKQGPR